MPKKVKKYVEEEDDDEEEEFEDEEDEDEELEKEEVARGIAQKTIKRKPGRPPKAPIQTAPTQEAKKRYIAFAQPARVGVADAETGEVVGEGETAVFDILADVLERLERIENTQGNLLE